MNKSATRLVAISDATFGNNEDLSSQLGHIIVLTDDLGQRNILVSANYKSKRVVRSVLGKGPMRLQTAC